MAAWSIPNWHGRENDAEVARGACICAVLLRHAFVCANAVRLGCGWSAAAAVRNAQDCTAHQTTFYVQVAHYLDADLQPWAAALAAALFADASVPAAEAQTPHQLEGSEAQAEEAPASKSLELLQPAWRRLDELARFGGATDAVLRAWRRPLLEQLPLTPAEWQPALIRSHATDGALELDFPTADACRSAVHAVHDVHTLSLDFSWPRRRAATEGISLTLQAVATMPALRSVELDLSRKVRLTRNRPSGIVEQLSPALSSLPQLVSLRLNGNGIGAAGAAALAPLLGALTALTLLCLGENKFGEEGTEALAPALSRLSRLAVLDLSCLGIGADGAVTLLQPLAALTALTALDLSKNSLARVPGEALAQALSCLSQLANLSLAYSSIGDEAAGAVAERLSALSTLTALNLNGNYIGVVGVQSLAPALRRLPRLAALDLESNGMGAAGTAALAEHLSALTTLTALSLCGHVSVENEDEDGDEAVESSIEALPPVLSRLSRMADLCLSMYFIEAPQAAALAAVLGGFTTLTRLHLCCNRFSQDELGDMGMRVLAPALSRLSRLADLDLGANNIDAAGAAVLAQPLGALTSLTALRLSETYVGDAEVEALAPALRRLSQLAVLDLSFNAIDAAGAAALAQPLGALAALTELNLALNKLGDAGAEALAPALSRLSRLAILRLQDNDLSDGSLVHLTPALACLPNLSELGLLSRNDFSDAAAAQLRASVRILEHRVPP